MRRRRVQFKRSAAQVSPADSAPSSKTSDDASYAMAQTEDDFEPFMVIPPHLTRGLPILDPLDTATSDLQARTVRECLPFMTTVNDPSSNPFDFDEHGIPLLDREAHIGFVQNCLGELPPQFVAMDASRPWLMYWSLLSLHIMGEDITKFSSGYDD